jgi:hypothetical protein
MSTWEVMPRPSGNDGPGVGFDEGIKASTKE